MKTLEKMPPSLPSLLEHRFSSALKASTIHLTDNKIATQTTNQNYEQRFALIEPPFDMNTKSSYVLPSITIPPLGRKNHPPQQLGRARHLLQEHPPEEELQIRLQHSRPRFLLDILQRVLLVALKEGGQCAVQVIRVHSRKHRHLRV